MRLKTRDCSACGLDISSRAPQARYCSDRCRSAPRFRGTYCIICEKGIYTTATSKKKIAEQRFCSKKCAFLADNPNFNENFFTELNLENSYWAGFIAADGNVCQPPGRSLCLSIGLQRRDGYHLEKLRRSIGAGHTYDIDTFDKRHEKMRYKTQYQLYSNKICNDLESRFYVTPRKSLTCEPPNVEGNFAHAFIAGYIDGDGCYTLTGGRPRIYIRGTEAMLNWIASVYDHNRKSKLSYGIHYIYFDRSDAVDIRESFKQKDLPLLDRKQNRWEEMGWNSWNM